MRIYLFHFIEENLCNTYKCTHDSTLKLKKINLNSFLKIDTNHMYIYTVKCLWYIYTQQLLSLYGNICSVRMYHI